MDKEIKDTKTTRFLYDWQINNVKPQPDQSSRLLTDKEMQAVKDSIGHPSLNTIITLKDRVIAKAQRDLTASDLVGRYSRIINELVAKLDKEHSAHIEALIEEIESNHKLGNAKWINSKDWKAIKAKYLKATHCKGEE